MLFYLKFLCFTSLILFILSIFIFIFDTRKNFSIFSLLYIGLWLGYPLFRLRSSYELKLNPIDTGSILRILMPSLIFLTLIIHKNYIQPIIKNLFKSPFLYIFLFCLLGLFSSIYSIHPGYTFFKAFEYIIAVCFGALCVETKDKEFFGILQVALLLNSILIATVSFSGLVFTSEAFVPSSGTIGYILFGIFPRIDANNAGVISAISIITCIYLHYISANFRQRIIYTLMLIAFTIILLLTQSRTSFVSIVLGILFILLTYYFEKRKIRLKVILTIILLIVLANQNLDYILNYLYRGNTLDLILNFSGRQARWQEAIELFYSNPLLGYGYMSAGRYQIYVGEGTTTLNTWIESLISLGILGTLFLFLFYFSSLFKNFKYYFKYKDKNHLNIKNTALCLIIAITLFPRTITSIPIVCGGFESLLFILVASNAIRVTNFSPTFKKIK